MRKVNVRDCGRKKGGESGEEKGKMERGRKGSEDLNGERDEGGGVVG